MRRNLRKPQVIKRKNFFPSLVITLLLWVSLGIIIYLVAPEGFGAVPLFFIILFGAMLFTTSIIFENRRTGFIITLSFILFLLLRFWGVGNIINFLLIAGLAVATNIYLSKS